MYLCFHIGIKIAYTIYLFASIQSQNISKVHKSIDHYQYVLNYKKNVFLIKINYKCQRYQFL